MSRFKVGDLVWAKMKGFPPWPGRVTNPPPDIRKPSTKKNVPVQCIFFFGSNNYGYIEDSNCKDYHQHKSDLINANKTSGFKDAVSQIEDYIKNKESYPDIDDNDADAEFNRLREPTPPEKSVKEKKPRKDAGIKRAGNSIKTPAAKKSRAGSTSLDNAPPSIASNHVAGARKNYEVFLQRPTPADLQRPETVPLDLKSITETLKEKEIIPSKLKFGFLGLGIMGSGIVKNLINSGHQVIVWNRTPTKCENFKAAGADVMQTPCDVIQAADITFACVSDPQASKDMVFGNCGVLQADLTDSKGYVEITGIDAETSQDIADAINQKGGRYLEAQVQGSKNQAEEGTLVILAAGDRTLFDDCQSCFTAMGKHSFYLGDVGNASQMNLVLQLMHGIAIAGIAEGMALADRAGLQIKDVVEVLKLTTLACPTILEKSEAIIAGNYPRHHPLMHMQKDLKLSLDMGDHLQQPLPLTATANEVFKHAKRLGYSDFDSSAVYIRSRF